MSGWKMNTDCGLAGCHGSGLRLATAQRVAGRGSAHGDRRPVGPQLVGQSAGTRRGGFTLLEIILALAILAGALAALGEVMRLADLSAARTRDETQAQILAASIMDEIVSGARPLAVVNGARLDMNIEPAWTHWIELESTRHVELLAVRVRVEQQLPAEQDPARFELVRWVLNPDYIPAATPQPEAESAAPAGSSAFGDMGGLDPSGGLP